MKRTNAGVRMLTGRRRVRSTAVLRALRGAVGLCALALLAAATGPRPTAWGAEPVAGVVIDVEGKPQVRRKDAVKFKRLKMNKFVYEGDVVKTGPGELAALAFIGGAEVRINEKSEFIVESGGGRKATSVFTKVGQAWTRLLHGRAGLSVRTPMAVAAVRGTESDIDVHEQMTVKVYEGHVDVMNDQGKQSLTAGMMTNVGGVGQAPAEPRAMGEGDYGTWQQGLTPEDIERNLRRLNKKAEKQGLLKIKYKDKDGATKELELKKK